jgi:hypothetical protein
MAQSMTSHHPAFLTPPEKRFLLAYAENGDPQAALKAVGLWDANNDRRYRTDLAQVVFKPDAPGGAGPARRRPGRRPAMVGRCLLWPNRSRRMPTILG